MWPGKSYFRENQLRVPFKVNGVSRHPFKEITSGPTHSSDRHLSCRAASVFNDSNIYPRPGVIEVWWIKQLHCLGLALSFEASGVSQDKGGWRFCSPLNSLKVLSYIADLIPYAVPRLWSKFYGMFIPVVIAGPATTAFEASDFTT
jgi:hypothetical protein